MAGECPGWYVLFLGAQKNADADGTLAGAGTITTNDVTITAIGGVAPYTYSWARVSGSTGPAISSTILATVNWTETFSPAAVHTAVWRCTVSDSGGSTPATVDVNVTLTWG